MDFGLGTLSKNFREYTADELRQNGMLLRFATNQTSDLCKVAVQQNYEALEHVKDQTPELCQLALEQNLFAVQLIKRLTKEIALDVVRKNGRMLVCMPQYQNDEDICRAAIEQNPSARSFVKISL